MAGRVDVLQWVRAKTVSGARLPFNLLEVAHHYTVPGELEFPRIVPQFNMYLRAAGHEAGRTAVRVRVHRQTGRYHWELVNDFEKGNLVLPFPDAGVVVEERVNLPHVRLTGLGLYAISVFFRCADDADECGVDWDRERTDWDPDEPEWAFGAVDYFVVNRS
jgi:hypothetical protein